MPTILITGGTGHLGRAVLARLARDGSNIRVLARHPGEDPDIKWMSGELATGDGIAEGPRGDRQDFAGPEIMRLGEIAKQLQAARGIRRSLLPVPLPAALARAAGGLTCPGGAVGQRRGWSGSAGGTRGRKLTRRLARSLEKSLGLGVEPAPAVGGRRSSRSMRPGRRQDGGHLVSA